MFRWNLMLRKLFGSLPQQSKARRPKATVKPHVEELTPRILPSASPLPVVSVASPPAVPSVAAITSYVSSMMELRSQLIATIEQDLSSVLNTIGQEIRQVIDSQWDNLMGINPSTPNASLNTTVTQPDSGMGRGNSSGVGRGSGVLAATQNTQNQTLKNSAQQTGHGSGSGSNATTASDADAPPHRLMQAQPLTGSGSTSGDTYQWDPGVGYVEYGLGSGGGGYVSTHIYTPKNLLAGNPVNWLKDGNVQVVPLGQSPTVPGNKPGDIAVLGYGSAGAAGLQPIEWNGNFTFSTLIVENGYAAQQTLDAGDKLEMTGVTNNTTLSVDASSTGNFNLQGNNNLQTDAGVAENDGTIYVNFLAAGSVRTIEGTTNEKGNVDFGANGKVNIINGGILNLGVGANLSQQSGSPINVTNGTLNIGDGNNSGAKNYSAFQLTTASADINIGPSGSMNVYQTGSMMIDGSNGGQGAVISNNGTVTLQGVTGVAGGGGINVPVQNHGKLNLGGAWTLSGKDASGNALSMDAGTINLASGADIILLAPYTQTGGVFNAVSDTTFGVQPGNGAANFNGGTVDLTSGAPVCILTTYQIVFNGATLKMRIWGNGENDEIICKGNCTIKGSSTINVTLVGSLSGFTWPMIEELSNFTITGDFQTVILPPGVREIESTTAWNCWAS